MLIDMYIYIYTCWYRTVMRVMMQVQKRIILQLAGGIRDDVKPIM